MRAPIRAICRREVARGLALAGLRARVADDGDAAADRLAALADSPAAGGVVLIERCLFDALPPPLVRRLRREGIPIVLPFPSPELDDAGVRRAEEDVLEILRQAIGYRVRLR